MRADFFKTHWQLILLNLIVLLCFVIGYGHFGDIIFDSFREAYIPEQMINGKVLYKNIFNIYAPFAYLFNAMLFKIFGVNLNVLYAAGAVATLGITNLFYLISNLFLEKKYSFVVILFFICCSILSPNVFNFFLPYSYGMLYGLLFIAASIYFVLCRKYPLAYLMYSFAICSKYEFLSFLPVLIYASGKKDIFKNIVSFLVPVAASYLPIVIQNAGIDNIIISYKWILAVTSSKTLYWFYLVTGLVCRPELIPIYLETFVKAAFAVCGAYFIKSYIFIPVLFVYCYFISTPEIIIWAFPFIFAVFVLRFRVLTDQERLVILSSLLVSAKIFFALILQSYGVYFVLFAILSILVLLPDKLRKSAAIVMILCGISLGIKNCQVLFSKNVKIKTDRGVVYAVPYLGNPVRELIEYIDLNTKPEDKILIYPECLSVNFLSARESDDKFYSLIPLYTEVFGEDLIIKRLEVIKPEYIVISNYDTSAYYFSHFGVDYALKISEFIKKNYEIEAEIGRTLRFTVYRIKSHHPSRMHA